MGFKSLKGRRGFRGFFSPINLNGVFACIFKTEIFRLLFEKLTIFPYRQYSNGLVINWGFKSVLCCEIEVGIYEKFSKMYKWFQEKITRYRNFAASRLAQVAPALQCRYVFPAAEWLDSSAVGIAQLAHTTRESILFPNDLKKTCLKSCRYPENQSDWWQCIGLASGSAAILCRHLLPVVWMTWSFHMMNPRRVYAYNCTTIPPGPKSTIQH